MSDAEGDDKHQSDDRPGDVQSALKEVLKAALTSNALARGIREACKALDRREADLCVLAENCNEQQYKKLIEALCAEHQIPLMKVPDNHELGEWCGLCKIDKEGKARKVVKCSSVVVKEIAKESSAWDVLQEYFKTQNAD